MDVHGRNTGPFRGRPPKVGVMDIIHDAGPSMSTFAQLETQLVFKQYAAIMPQVVKVWCQRMGCDVSYATHFSQAPLLSQLPDDLDVVFVYCCTQEAHMAYALSRYYQKRGCLTVLGGPHAHSFPEDAERFFDVIVGACNEELIREILVDRPRGVELSSEPPQHFPTVEERMEDIRSALFYRGYPLLASTIPLYASVGCPYTYDFCIDYDSKYRTLDVGTLEEDLRFINANFPNVTIAFHDANFGVRFDETLSVLEKVNNRTRYGVGLTMSVLSNPERVRRLRDTGCRYVQCGIESLSGFHAKQGRQRDLSLVEAQSKAKDFFRGLAQNFEMTQANIIFGLDDDAGPELVDAYVDFIEAGDAGIINMCIPTPFAKTPMYDTLQREGRILPLPFMFYRDSYLAVRPKHYSARDYYDNLITILKASTSAKAIAGRFASTRHGGHRRHALSKTFGDLVMRAVDRFQFLPTCIAIRKALEEPDMWAFYEGRTSKLPALFRQEFEGRWKRFDGLVTADELAKPIFPEARVNVSRKLRVV